MPLETLFISGPPRAGKTTMARLIVDEVRGKPVHYLRMRRSCDGQTNAIVPETAIPPCDGRRWASSHVIQYSPERVFEILPDGLRSVRRLDRNAMIVVEADPDAVLRHAFPYDYRLFVMPPPMSLETVFRDEKSAARALQQVMQDTAAFASEIFGVFDPSGLEDSVGVRHSEPLAARSGVYVEQLHVDDQQVRHFLNSPLGAEIASRIQLQPEYCAVVESDVAVINTGVLRETDCLEACLKRLEKLLKRVRHDARRQSVLYWGDIADVDDEARTKLIGRLKSLLSL